MLAQTSEGRLKTDFRGYGVFFLSFLWLNTYFYIFKKKSKTPSPPNKQTDFCPVKDFTDI